MNRMEYERVIQRMEYESILHAVIPHYPMRVHDWQWIRPDACLLHTNYGQKLMRVERDQVQVQVRGQVLDALAIRGIRRTPRHIRTIYGDSFMSVDGYICTVSDHLRFQEVEVPKYLREVTENLAHVHSALSDIAVRPVSVPVLPHVSNMLENGINQLERVEVICKNERTTPFSVLLLSNLSAVRERAHRNYALAKAAGIDDQVRTKADRMILVHYDASSVAFTDLGRMATLGFDEVSIGDPEMDVMSLCRSLYEHGLSEEIPHVLEHYRKARVTDAEFEKRVISVVGYPFSVIDVANSYMHSERRFESVWRTRLFHALRMDSGKP